MQAAQLLLGQLIDRHHPAAAAPAPPIEPEPHPALAHDIPHVPLTTNQA